MKLKPCKAEGEVGTSQPRPSKQEAVAGTAEVGCGGSQKSELATANLMKKQSPGWDYEEVDVTAFLKDQFPPGAQVDALHETEADSRWRKGIVVKQMEKVTKTESGDESTEFVWQIKSDDDSGDPRMPWQ